MCGRTCLTLEPDEIRHACKYKIPGNQKTSTNENQKKSENNNKIVSHDEIIKTEAVEKQADDHDYLLPEWRAEFNCGRNYTPSYNIAPTDITPVLVSASHFADENDKTETDAGGERIIVPMMWGMIPFWHKGDYRKHGLTTNNCRLEHMLDSKLYRGPFRRGQRCVVLCEGFYEWQTTKSVRPSERAAHLLFMPQKNESVKIYDRDTWQSAGDLKLLCMAGLFDVWEDEHGDKMYSYSIITFESSKIMSWMHYRMPAILETEEQMNNWLDYKRVTDDQALATLRPATQLLWYRISNLVNNSRNKSAECNKPLEIIRAERKHKVPKSKIMTAWLQQRKRREQELAKLSPPSDDDEDDSPNEEGENDQLTLENHRYTDSDSEAEYHVAKRPRYRDYKRSLKANSKSSSPNSIKDAAAAADNGAAATKDEVPVLLQQEDNNIKKTNS